MPYLTKSNLIRPAASWQTTLVLFVIAATMALASGCTALSTFPVAARAGDTVVLAVGSPDNLTAANIQSIDFVYDNAINPSVDLKPGLRSIFKLFADKASQIYDDPGIQTKQISASSGHEPWLTIMVVDLPPESNGLVPGNGQVVIRTIPGAVIYPNSNSHVNDLQANGLRVGLEIIHGLDENGQPALGASAEFPYEWGMGLKLPLPGMGSQLAYLEAKQHVLVKPPYEEYSYPWPLSRNYGAVEILLDLSACTDKGGPLINDDFRIVAEDMHLLTRSQRSVTWSIVNDQLHALFISPIGQLMYSEPRFSIVPNGTTSFTCTPSFSINGIKHYDVNGDIVTGPIAGINPLLDYTIELR